MIRRGTLLPFGLLALWAGACRDSIEPSAPAAEPATASPQGAPRLAGRLDELRALGYTGWDEDSGEPRSGSGVIRYDPEATQDWGRVWADDASTIHRILPSGETLDSIDVPGRTQVEFVRVLAGGRLLCLSVDEGITLLEPGGAVVFHLDMAAHHEVVVVPDGSSPGKRTFAVLVHREHSFRGRQVRFDGIVLVSEATGRTVDAAGRPTDQDAWAWDSFAQRESLVHTIDGPVHALDGTPPAGASEASPHTGDEVSPAGMPPKGRIYDYFHANALAFEDAAHLTVCLRNVDAIVSLAWPTGKPTSAFGPGVLDWPHAPSFLGARLLIFDNGKHRGWSRVIEVSRESGSILWEWRGPAERPLWSEVRGFAQRLPNGNTLVTESERGRAMEVTQDGSVVWEFLNPETRHNGQRGVARRRIYRVMAFPLEPAADPSPTPGRGPGRADSISGEDQSDQAR